MRRSAFLAGAGGLVAATSLAEAQMLVGTRRALLSGNNFGQNLLVNPGFLNNAAGWSAPGPVSANGPGGANAVGYLGIGYPNYTTFGYQFVSVVPGGVYAGSMWMNANAATDGNPNIFVRTMPGYVLSDSINSLFGVTGVYHLWYTAGNFWRCPAGVTQIQIGFSSWNCTVTSGQYLYASQPYFARVG